MPADFEKENDEGFIPRPVVRKSLAPQKKTLTKQEEIGQFDSVFGSILNDIFVFRTQQG